MENQRPTTLDGTGSISDRGEVELVGGRLKAPENIIMSVGAAKQYYRAYERTHRERLEQHALVEGLIAGNAPYNAEKIEKAGLSHMSNFNDLSPKAFIDRASLAYWNLTNQTTDLVVFTVSRLEGVGEDHEYKSWGNILSRNWTKAIKERWKDYPHRRNMLSSQLVKFGYSPIIWPDERDFRWKNVECSKFLCGDGTTVTTEEWDCICIETTFTISRLYQIYLEFKDSKDSDWDTDELEKLILRKAQRNNKDAARWKNAMDMQIAIQNKSFPFADTFNESITLVSLLFREYSEKISHFIFDPSGEGGDDFLFKVSEQYNNFHEAVVMFTYSPGEFKLFGNRGVGHKIFPVCQALIQAINGLVDMTKMATTLLVRTNSTPGHNADPIRIIQGTVNDIGQAELIPNPLGSGINQVIGAHQYLYGNLERSIMMGGDDPSQRDADSGSKSAVEVQINATKEFGIGKQSIAHFYMTEDIVAEQMTIKMLNSKEGYPGNEIVEYWKKLCLKEGVPPQVFEVPEDTEPGWMPEHLSVRAARVAGDGSNIGLTMGLRAVQGIAGGFPEDGQYNYREDVINASLGQDHVLRYLGNTHKPGTQTTEASVAQLENLAIQDGKQVVAVSDNSHKTHIMSHMGFLNTVIQQVEAQQVDQVTADEIFQVGVVHCGQHFQFLEQDPVNQQFVEENLASWQQITKYAQRNRIYARNQEKTEVKRREDEQKKLESEMMEQDRKDKIAVREQGRKDFESQEKQERAREQSELKGEILRKNTDAKIESSRELTQSKIGNERAKVVSKPQEVLANTSTSELQNRLGDLGTTPNPADFE